MSRQIAAYREEKNVMLIADTTELLSKVIEGSDAPFIYEKTGTHVDHYMIDEFQDTSGMQWNNFRPLIEESLAHSRDNLIVGDVKQKHLIVSVTRLEAAGRTGAKPTFLLGSSS
ncbi:MAG: UvrD-helicase domain-containing protein [Parabacteroides merdae]